MAEIIKSIAIGSFFGAGVYFSLSHFHASDADFLSIVTFFSVTCLRIFSPKKKIILGLKSLLLVDWLVITIVPFVFVFSVYEEILIIRIIIFICFFSFFLAGGVSTRNPIYLFRRPKKSDEKE